MDLTRIDQIKINFIVGPGRSGTTLLVVLLNQFENCIATPEVHHFIYFYKKYKDIQTVDQKLIDDYKQYISRFFVFKKNPLIGPPDFTLIDSLEHGQKINYGQLTKLIYLGLFGRKGIENNINVIVDKNPYYTLHIDKICRVFPEAKIVALIRDYRGYILSNLQSQKPTVTKKTTMYHAYVWNMFLRNIWNASQKYHSAIKVVQYEKLVLDKEKTIKDIVEFFGLTYSPSIFDFHKAVKQKIEEVKLPEKKHERMMKKINDLSVPINADRVYSWRNGLTQADLEKADFVSARMGEKYGYVAQTNPTAFKKMIFFIISFPSFLRVKLFDFFHTPGLYFFRMYKLNRNIK